MPANIPWGAPERPWPLSVGLLDSYAYFTGAGADSMSEADFMARLNRTAPDSVPATIGRAFHKAIEEIQKIADRDYHLACEIVDPSSAIIFAFPTQVIELPQCRIVEQDISATFETAHGWVELRGVIDALHGDRVIDIKTTRRPSLEIYQDSWQWRAYLAMLGEQYRALDYHVFQLKYSGKIEQDIVFATPVTIPIVDSQTLTCWRYPALESDVHGIVSELADYVARAGWEPPPKRQMEIF